MNGLDMKDDECNGKDWSLELEEARLDWESENEE